MRSSFLIATEYLADVGVTERALVGAHHGHMQELVPRTVGRPPLMLG